MTADARFVSLVPVQLARLLDVADQDKQLAGILNSFDGILVGGQALAPTLRERAELHGVTLTATYGSSETAGGCVYNGVPIGSTIVRERTRACSRSPGRRSPRGTWAMPSRTDAAFHVDAGHRWYRTGDLGQVDARQRSS